MTGDNHFHATGPALLRMKLTMLVRFSKEMNGSVTTSQIQLISAISFHFGIDLLYTEVVASADMQYSVAPSGFCTFECITALPLVAKCGTMWLVYLDHIMLVFGYTTLGRYTKNSLSESKIDKKFWDCIICVILKTHNVDQN